MASYQLDYLQVLLASFWPPDPVMLLLFPGLPLVSLLSFIWALRSLRDREKYRWGLIFLLFITFSISLWWFLMPLSQVGAGWQLSNGKLRITAWAGAAELEVKNTRVALVDSSSSWRPVLRTNGYGTPGLTTGWCKLANGQKAVVFCYLCPQKMLVLQYDGRYYVLAHPGVEKLYHLLLAGGAQEGVEGPGKEMKEPGRPPSFETPQAARWAWLALAPGIAGLWFLFGYLVDRVKRREINKGRTLFREVQRMPGWLLLLLLFLAAVFWIMMLQFFVLSHDPPEYVTPVLWLVFGVIFPLVLGTAYLETVVQEGALYFRYFPYHLSYRCIPFSRLAKSRVRIFDPFGELGRWGIWWWGADGVAYTVTGNQGVELFLTDGKVVLLGSQRPEELQQVLEQALTGNPAGR
ncbi:DUF6141 family protein [Ammonifex thiophilus]|uniref:Bacterial Pleckstrin homology domain-containing protein n=1 Tax=Ammonifex thiophilus TaxID=444093 RepID=A0A3D8P3F3_9THEO|nr:DUF6141 family protein [Ammonifex thiophilus]RDV81709.1 hypothetical protein DXX99_09110 [Ammonifex thiophilus]